MLETGITYAVSFPGLVPPVEEREASRFSGYSWKEWQELPYNDRVECVAYFRVRRRIELHQHEAQERDIRRRQRQAERGKRR